MAAVSSENLDSFESLCCRYHRSIDESEPHICILVQQRIRTRNIFGLQRFDYELAVGYSADEDRFRFGRDSGVEEVADFGKYAHRNNYWILVCAPPAQHAVVPRIVGVDQRVQRPGVRDYRQACGSRHSSSSDLSAVRFFPLANLAATEGTRPGALGSAR